ncbi:hypothetical protein HMPREF1982_02804 [Clostridiales bacterium oral taxon 876 str. F0540]|nr:hypothetical protein HMPREF1982_02804 [Clostridiales bacterium oral taxon 876 str. F0540]
MSKFATYIYKEVILLFIHIMKDIVEEIRASIDRLNFLILLIIKN